MKKAEKIEILKTIEKKKNSLYKKIAKLAKLESEIRAFCGSCDHQKISITKHWNNDPYCGGYNEEYKHYFCGLRLNNDDKLCYRFKRREG